MASSKTAAPLKGIFESAKAQAAQAVMQPSAPAPTPSSGPAPPAARNRKAGGGGVRVSAYFPPENSEAFRYEVIRRTVAGRQTVSLNDVLCSILSDWLATRKD